MDERDEELIQKVTEEFQNEGEEISKIYWNGNNGKVIVVTKPKNKMDGIYLYENTLDMKRPFSPTEDFKIFETVVTDEYLIYDNSDKKESTDNLESSEKSEDLSNGFKLFE